MTSKFCDAADWFRPEIHEIITNELREVPRFHRKQWESAMIFLALRQAGKLRPDNVGLSMGGGKELILYALAPHLRQLVVTDLYDTQTDWDCAKTNNPDAFIRHNKPFPVDNKRLMALRMDMRDLKFPDRSFDFCYSTCAVEHIGRKDDFVRHFNEVARVLEDDGIYVFTTEILYGDRTIEDEHNHVFSLRDLHEIFAQSNLVPEEEFDARITEHKINYPSPSYLKSLAHCGPRLFAETWLQESPHIQLMRGKHPFTCAIFVMRKRLCDEKVTQARFIGLDSARAFMQSGVDVYRSVLENSSVCIDPLTLLPGERSRFLADHAEFLSAGTDHFDSETVFHSDYFWFGSGKRVFDVALDSLGEDESEIDIRVHRFKTLASHHVDCADSSRKIIRGSRTYRIEVDLDEGYSYAVLAKARRGPCMFNSIAIMSYPMKLAPAVPAAAESLSQALA